MPAGRRPIDERLRDAGLPTLPRSAWLEIDLGAIVANLAAIRHHCGPSVRVEPVVKADAYGHGATAVARALEDAGADGLSVATIDEAFELRAAGIRLPLLVLFPVPAEHAGAAARQRIALTAGDRQRFDDLLGAVAAERARGVPPLDLHLEVETGLGRGGVAPQQVAGAAAAIVGSPGVRLAGTWSHLAAADDPATTAAQVERFDAALAALAGAGIAAGRRHFAASGGLLVGVPTYDAIRPGLLLYGVPPDGVAPVGDAAALVRAVRPAMAVRARPVRVAELPAGHGVSYGPSFTTDRPSRIATLPIGYGDGWARSGSNRGEALVRGVRVPLVGAIAMDALMADVTDLPGEAVDSDDVFTLIGADGEASITAGDVARSRTTNSWEVVTAMARRMPRVYDLAAGSVGLRTLIDREADWLASNSGTATSATSRSTRS
jgi:alanine racemase